MTETDVVVVGGGAAGIAALRTLADAGVPALLLEAGDRLGGRAHTVAVDEMPLDLGAGWLHSAEHNPWVGVAEKAGVPVDRTLPRWREQWRELGFPRAEQKAASDAFATFTRRMAEEPPGSDIAADLLNPGGAWNDWIDALSGFINGAPTQRMSARDWAAYDAAATETDWRVPSGYGALIAGHARGLPVALATPVSAIDRDAATLGIVTPRGTIRARAAIITVSTNVLAAGTIALSGHDAVLHAAASLPLGLADKLFLAVPGDAALDADAHLIGNPHARITGTYTLRPFGRPVIECMLGGEGAEVLAQEGLDGAAGFAVDELVALLGGEWRGQLRLIAGSCWARATHVRGGYSHALPGHRAARATLSTVIDPRIRFAGEACSTDSFSTAHGAYRTGVAAAQALIAAR